MPFLDVNGTSLRYHLAGDGEGVLVLLHEMGGALESWDDVVPALVKTHRILRYDMRGHGGSEKIRGPYSAADGARDLAALLDALDLRQPVALAGCAVGASIALQFAADYPERAARLVAMAPSTGIKPEARGWALDWAAAIEREGMRRFVDAEMAPNAFPPVLRTDAARFMLFRGRQLANDPASFAATYRMLAATDIGERLGSIRCPTLLIAGTHDVPRSPAVVATLVDAFPDARMEVLDSGHFMMIQTPEEVASVMLDFLSPSPSLPARSAAPHG